MTSSKGCNSPDRSYDNLRNLSDQILSIHRASTGFHVADRLSVRTTTVLEKIAPVGPRP